MKCIFCFSTTNTFNSVEHIIPESLGKKELILKKGIVCDTCNGYFSREIEGPLLRLPFFTSTRHLLNIPSKKRKIPDNKGFMIYPEIGITIHKDRDGNESFTPQKPFTKRKKNALITVEFAFPMNNVYVSKFLGKIAIELMAFTIDYTIDFFEQESLKILRKYVKAGQKNEFWPYYSRNLFSPSNEFQNPKTQKSYKINIHQVLIMDGDKILFLQVLLLGAELTFDINSRTNSHIEKWLSEINDRSLVLESALDKWENN